MRRDVNWKAWVGLYQIKRRAAPVSLTTLKRWSGVILKVL
jgi:hypothetical protein